MTGDLSKQPQAPVEGKPAPIAQELRTLAVEAGELQAGAQEAYAARDQTKPWTAQRNQLQQQISDANARGEIQEAKRLSEEITECHQELSRIWESFRQFMIKFSRFDGRLRSALKRLPRTREATKLRKQIERLPLLNRGLGKESDEARDDFTETRLCLEALADALDPPALKVLSASRRTVIVDEEHERYLRLFDQVLTNKKMKLDTWIEDHHLSRTPVIDYRGGRIKGRVSSEKRLQIEAAIKKDACELGMDSA